MEIVVWDGETGKYFELNEKTYLIDASEAIINEDGDVRIAALMTGIPVTRQTARELYEHALQKHESEHGEEMRGALE